MAAVTVTLVAVCPRFSVTVKMDPKIAAAIAAIG
jgi:hypothetical protein